jgi:pimeloyl-ACP methyl ester carboxylesterase
MVLLHGLTGSGATWMPVARILAPHFDVILPDARGHGGSSASPIYTYDDLAADVVGLISALGLPHPILVGHSMGGMTAALVASQHPSLARALVLVDPTFLSPERQREVHASDVAAQHRQALATPSAELLAQAHARHPHRSAELLELQVDARLRTDPAAFAILAPPNPDYRALIRSLTIPTRLIIGDTTIVTRAMADELHHLNPLVCIEQLAHASHGLPFDHPEVLATLLAASLA